MPKFTVIVTRDLTESALVQVDADNETAALLKVQSMDNADMDFALDENIPQPGYITGCDQEEE